MVSKTVRYFFSVKIFSNLQEYPLHRILKGDHGDGD